MAVIVKNKTANLGKLSVIIAIKRVILQKSAEQEVLQEEDRNSNRVIIVCILQRVFRISQTQHMVGQGRKQVNNE